MITVVAHKTGDITKIAHDAGIVFRPDGSAYVLVVLTRGFDKLAEANEVIADISRDVWLATGGARPVVSRMPRERSDVLGTTLKAATSRHTPKAQLRSHA